MSEDLSELRMRIIRLKEVMERTGLGRSSIYKLQAEGRFPKSIALTDRAIGFYAYEVDAWIQEKLDARHEKPRHDPRLTLGVLFGR
jgi:prophage regulatory protein